MLPMSPMRQNLAPRLEQMSHTGTVKQAFLNKRAQPRLKLARTSAVKAWEVIVSIIIIIIIIIIY
jgi:hypothetical protein